MVVFMVTESGPDSHGEAWDGSDEEDLLPGFLGSFGGLDAFMETLTEVVEVVGSVETSGGVSLRLYNTAGRETEGQARQTKSHLKSIK